MAGVVTILLFVLFFFGGVAVAVLSVFERSWPLFATGAGAFFVAPFWFAATVILWGASDL